MQSGCETEQKWLSLCRGEISHKPLLHCMMTARGEEEVPVGKRESAMCSQTLRGAGRGGRSEGAGMTTAPAGWAARSRLKMLSSSARSARERLQPSKRRRLKMLSSSARSARERLQPSKRRRLSSTSARERLKRAPRRLPRWTARSRPSHSNLLHLRRLKPNGKRSASTISSAAKGRRPRAGRPPFESSRRRRRRRPGGAA